MTTVGIAKLKNNLSSYLKKIKQGHEILITDHGEPVAKISSLSAKDKKPTFEDKVQALVDHGVLHYDFSKQKKFSNSKPIKISGENTMSRWLIEEGRKD